MGLRDQALGQLKDVKGAEKIVKVGLDSLPFTHHGWMVRSLFPFSHPPTHPPRAHSRPLDTTVLPIHLPTLSIQQILAVLGETSSSATSASPSPTPTATPAAPSPEPVAQVAPAVAAVLEPSA